jgi:uncharacterized lipoprotein YbaY
MTPILDGYIIFDKNARSFPNATVYVRLRDVSLLDSPSKVISQTEIRHVKHSKNKSTKVKFSLHGEVKDKRRTYSVSAHVDVDHDGEIGLGDFINTKSYPVLTFGHQNRIYIHVKEVT